MLSVHWVIYLSIIFILLQRGHLVCFSHFQICWYLVRKPFWVILWRVGVIVRDYGSRVEILDLKCRALLFGLSLPGLPAAFGLRSLPRCLVLLHKTTVFSLPLVSHLLSAVGGNLSVPHPPLLLLLVPSDLVCSSLEKIGSFIDLGSFRWEQTGFFNWFFWENHFF